jgi:preprotein translocase subunit SecG
MNIFYILLSVLMVLDCVVLIFLVLLQLPKKEAGAGMAFGGSATDALFGAGSGNALTTITKYSAGIFFSLALIMAIITAHRGPSSGSALEELLSKPGKGPAEVLSPGSPVATNTNMSLQMPPLPAPAASASNAPEASTNSAAPAPAPARSSAPPSRPPATNR